MPPKKRQKTGAGPTAEQLVNTERLRQALCNALVQLGGEQLNGIEDTTEWLLKTWEAQVKGTPSRPLFTMLRI